MSGSMEKNNYFGCTKDCPDRHPGCHDSCEKYRSAKKQYLDEQTVIKKARYKESAANAAKAEGIKRCVRSR